MLTDEYKVRLANSIRNMENAGESPENIQRFVNAFKVKYGNYNQTTSPDTIKQTHDINKTGFKSLVEATNKMINPVETYKNPVANAKAMAGLGLQAGQIAGGFLLPEHSAYSITPATEYAYQKLQGKSNKEAAKEALIAGGIDAAMPFIGNIAGKTIGNAIKKGGDAVLKKTIPFFTGVSKESTERVINNPSILKSKIPTSELDTSIGENINKVSKKIAEKNKRLYDKIGKNAQLGLEDIVQKTGQLTGETQQLIKGVKKEINPNKIINDIKKEIDYITFDKKNALTDKDKFNIKSLLDDLTPEKSKILDASGKPIQNKTISIERLEGIKQRAQKLAEYDKEVSDRGNNIVQGIANKVREEIHKNLPNPLKSKYIQIHKKYEDLMPIKNKVSKIVNQEGGGNLKNFIKRAFNNPDVTLKNEPELLELDKILPKKYKFYNEMKNLIEAQEMFPKKLISNLPEETGSNIRNVLRKKLGTEEFVKNEPQLKMLDKILPAKNKFYGAVKNQIAKEEFSSFFPKNAALRALPVLTSGSIGYITRNPRVIAAAGAIGALTSPRLAGKTIQAKAWLENALKVASTDKRVGAATRKLAIELSKAFRQEKE